MPDPCTNGDVCYHKTESDGTAGHQCAHPCIVTNPCQNNGTCYKYKNGGASCDCATTGYSGVNCQIGMYFNCVHPISSKISRFVFVVPCTYISTEF